MHTVKLSPTASEWAKITFKIKRDGREQYNSVLEHLRNIVKKIFKKRWRIQFRMKVKRKLQLKNKLEETQMGKYSKYYLTGKRRLTGGEFFYSKGNGESFFKNWEKE